MLHTFVNVSDDDCNEHQVCVWITMAHSSELPSEGSTMCCGRLFAGWYDVMQGTITQLTRWTLLFNATSVKVTTIIATTTIPIYMQRFQCQLWPGVAADDSSAFGECGDCVSW
jgi:hypothetical protein